MKKIILTALAAIMLSSTAVSAAESSSVYDPSSPNHICRQLGTKVCHDDNCKVLSFNNISKPKPVETTTKPQFETTTRPQLESTTKPQLETTTRPQLTETQTETTTRDISTQTTTRREPTTQTTTVRETTTHTTTKKETTTETTTNAAPTGTYAQQILTLVNNERAKEGLSPLTLSSEVSRVAQAKAEDMKNNNYFSHTSPTYGSPFDMLKKFGVSYRTAGENIAKGQKTPQAVVSAWMNSPGHRANIMNKNFTKLGVGYTGGSSPYWVQMFIG